MQTLSARAVEFNSQRRTWRTADTSAGRAGHMGKATAHQSTHMKARGCKAQVLHSPYLTGPSSWQLACETAPACRAPPVLPRAQALWCMRRPCCRLPGNDNAPCHIEPYVRHHVTPTAAHGWMQPHRLPKHRVQVGQLPGQRREQVVLKGPVKICIPDHSLPLAIPGGTGQRPNAPAYRSLVVRGKIAPHSD